MEKMDPVEMASTLLAMEATLVAMASNVRAMAWPPTCRDQCK